VKRTQRSWLLGVNSNLADDINVLWVQAVPEDFHARFSAQARIYRYVILNQPVRSALARTGAWWVRQPLDVAAMAAGAQYLHGQHDFSSFRASACQSNNPIRHIRRLEIDRVDDWITIECEANAFLHHMVRNIVGSLVKVGRGEATPEWIGEILAKRDRRLAAATAPPNGLTLVAIRYPREYALPGT